MAKNDDKVTKLLSERLAAGDELVEYLPAHKEPFPRIVLALLFIGTGILPGVIIYYSMLKYYVIGLTKNGLLMLRTNSAMTQVAGDKMVPFEGGQFKASKIGMRRVIRVKPSDGPWIELELSPDHKKVSDGVKRRDRIFDALAQQAASAKAAAKKAA